MKKILFVIVTLVTLAQTSCSVLEQVNEYNRFIQCDFRIEDVRVSEIIGIDITSLGDKGDLGISEMMMITKKLYTGEFPATVIVNLKATNNHEEKAAISGLDWLLVMKGEELLSGTVNREVNVPPHESAEFPVMVHIDLFKLLRSKSLSHIMAFAFGKDQYEQLEKLGVEIKIKPYYRTGSGVKKYPGYLTVRP